MVFGHFNMGGIFDDFIVVICHCDINIMDSTNTAYLRNDSLKKIKQHMSVTIKKLNLLILLTLMLCV